MKVLDKKVISKLNPMDFRAVQPFPWKNIEGFLTDDAHRKLIDNLPPLSEFTRSYGKHRRYGQEPHDRYSLEYRSGMSLPEPWGEFLNELEQGSHRDFVAKMLGHDRFLLSAHWHFASAGSSVSPHYDATWKLGSQVFYLNDEKTWDPRWGGETLVLDDAGKIAFNAAPAFDDFESEASFSARGNRSLLFLRTDRSWHGVRPVRCPKGEFRKVFIVEFREKTIAQRIRTWFGKAH